MSESSESRSRAHLLGLLQEAFVAADQQEAKIAELEKALAVARLSAPTTLPTTLSLIESRLRKVLTELDENARDVTGRLTSDHSSHFADGVLIAVAEVRLALSDTPLNVYGD